MRFFILVSSCLLLVCCARPAFDLRSSDDRTNMQRLRSRAVLVNVYCDGVLRGSGSGILVGGGYIATASHVVPGNGDCTALVRGRLAKLAARDSTNDVAILYSPLVNMVEMQWATPYLGQRVICVGWATQYRTGQVMEQVTRGELIADYYQSVRVGCSFNKGSSGGPIFNEQGKLVGMATAMNPTYNDEYYATPARAIRELLDQARDTSR